MTHPAKHLLAVPALIVALTSGVQAEYFFRRPNSVVADNPKENTDPTPTKTSTYWRLLTNMGVGFGFDLRSVYDETTSIIVDGVQLNNGPLKDWGGTTLGDMCQAIVKQVPGSWTCYSTISGALTPQNRVAFESNATFAPQLMTSVFGDNITFGMPEVFAGAAEQGTRNQYGSGGSQ